MARYSLASPLSLGRTLKSIAASLNPVTFRQFVIVRMFLMPAKSSISYMIVAHTYSVTLLVAKEEVNITTKYYITPIASS